MHNGLSLLAPRMTDAPLIPPPDRGSAAEVFRVFLRLGLLSFGGPIAHLGYFHTEFVQRRRWCSEETFAEIVAIAQSMPGPASSQVGFALGLLRAGWPGGIAAWTAFTMPSALLMLAFAFGHQLLTGSLGLGVVHGLQLVAVAVVAQAILSMRKSLAPDAPRIALALAAAAIVFFSFGTLLAIVAGAFAGLLLPRPPQLTPAHPLAFHLPRPVGFAAAALLLALLPILHIAAALSKSQPVAVFNAFYRTGALVFGGGHVVLPLLESAVVATGWVDQQTFLSGYGAAQALPGPLFTFAAYLGAAIRPSAHPVLLSALALIAIFLPGLLAVVAVLPFWSHLRQRPLVQAALRGINAAVVGVLIAAFLRPVCSSALHSFFDSVVAVTALVALLRWKLPPWLIVIAVAALSALAAIA
jgi:chromate transporter